MRGCLTTLAACLVIIAAAVAGWGLWLRAQAPTDLAFESAEVRRVATGVSGDGKTFHYDDVLLVTFRSRADLQTLANRYGFHLHITVSPCVQGSVDLAKRLFGTYKESPGDDYGEVDVWSYDEATQKYRTRPSGPRDASGTIRYYFTTYLELSGSLFPNRYHYDLVSSPMELCAVLEGSTDILGEFFFPAFTSNTIVIPRNSVADAIARAHVK